MLKLSQPAQTSFPAKPNVQPPSLANASVPSSRSSRTNMHPRQGKGSLGFFFKFIILMVFARIGEAVNPGPILGTSNPCGALGKASMYTSLPGGDTEAKIWGMAESHLTTPGIARFRTELKHQGGGWRICHGAPAPAVSRAVGSIGGKHSGVAVLSNCPVRPLATDWSTDQWATARIQACAVHVRNQWIKVGAFYGYAKDAHTKATKERTDALLQTLTQKIVIQSRGYRAIVGDFNATTGDLPQFAIWKEHGFREIQEIAAARWQQPIRATCKNTSTKDHVWISPELADKLLEVHVCATLISLTTQLCMVNLLTLEPLSQCQLGSSHIQSSGAKFRKVTYRQPCPATTCLSNRSLQPWRLRLMQPWRCQPAQDTQKGTQCRLWPWH